MPATTPSTNRQSVEIGFTSNPAHWMRILDEIGAYDFYHLPAYQRLSERRLGGQAVLPVFRYGGYVMAFPLLVREIAIPGIRSDGYRDAACVPGLTGPIAPHTDLPNHARDHLMAQFHEYLAENRVVSVYSRLHFLMGQEAFLAGYGERVEEGLEITVDLTLRPEEQFARYRLNHRRDVNKLRSKGFVCKEVGPEYLDEFLGIYYETMDYVQAKPLFYHERAYFEYLLNEMSDASRLFACMDGETLASIGVFTHCKGAVRYLYGGTAAEYRRLSPSKLVLDQVRIWGNSIGAHTFHLGGGNDSLCTFKMGFGGREHVYSTWRYVADQEAYHDLCARAFALAGRRPNDGYFPEYRSPSLNLGQEA